MLAVDATVMPGDVLTVMGPSGSGKSTLLSFIGGFLDPVFAAEGRVFSGETELTVLPPEERHAGILFQDPLLFPHMSVVSNVAFAIPPSVTSRPERLAMAEEALAGVELAGMGTRDPATGADTSPTTTKTAPTSNEACSGKAGKAKVSAKVSKKPNAVKNGKKGAFKITVKNSGTASAKNVVITAPGAKVKGGKIAPGKSKTYNVKAKVKGKKGKKVTVKFKVKGNGFSAGTKAKVKVK